MGPAGHTDVRAANPATGLGAQGRLGSARSPGGCQGFTVSGMDSLEQRIAARLHQALDHHAGANIIAPTAERGLAAGGPDAPEIALTVQDVARIAAQEAEDFRTTRV